MNKELLIKYLNNKCTGREFEEVAGWIQTEAHQKEASGWGLEQWKMLESQVLDKDDPKFNALLYKIHYEINLRQRQHQNSKFILFAEVTKWLGRAAAILFLPLLGVVFYLLSDRDFQKNQIAELGVDSLEIIAPVGSRTVVQLSDGTEVNLNYGSRIKYPRNFGNVREVTLSGEGYFDVARNPDKPFVVKTGKLNIRALGTKFNIHAYPGDDVIETTLAEGKVVIEKAVQGESQVIGTMVPGQHVDYQISSGKITSTKGSIEKYIAWKDGKLVFDNESISDIAGKLGRMFNVDIEVAENVRDYTYTVTFFNDPLYLILDLMTETAPIKYEILPRHKQPDGTYSKQKIRIEKRI